MTASPSWTNLSTSHRNTSQLWHPLKRQSFYNLLYHLHREDQMIFSLQTSRPQKESTEPTCPSTSFQMHQLCKPFPLCLEDWGGEELRNITVFGLPPHRIKTSRMGNKCFLLTLWREESYRKAIVNSITLKWIDICMIHMGISNIYTCTVHYVVLLICQKKTDTKIPQFLFQGNGVQCYE